MAFQYSNKTYFSSKLTSHRQNDRGDIISVELSMRARLVFFAHFVLTF
jgi:hypothetical protein